MQHGKIWVIAMCVMLLAGCQKVPEEVKENMEQYGENPQEKIPEFHYCPVEELQDAALPDEGYGNLNLPGSIDFSHVEGAGILHIVLEKDFLQDETVGKYASLFRLDKEKFVDDGESEFGKHILYDEDSRHMDIAQNGGIAYMAGQSYDFNPGTVEETYSIDRDDISDIQVNFPSESVRLSKLCRDVEKWMDTNMPIDGISHKISDVYFRTLEGDGGQALSMCAEYEYKGIRLNNHFGPLTEDGEGLEPKILTASFVTEMNFESPGLPTYFSRNENFSIESVEPAEQVISLESALQAVGKKISGFGNFQIDEILPLYALYYESDTSKMPGTRIEGRPVYAFLTKGADEMEPNMGILKQTRYGHFFLVDMITGEISTDLE